MKILSLKSKNVKRLRAVEINPDGNVVVIGGRNGQGKSSVLDSIEYALGGKDSICREPVRRGEERAEVVCDLGEFTVRRTFTPDGGGTLTVQAKDGAKYDKPQTKLDDLIGRLSFDPLEFSRMKPKDQADTLRALIGVDTSLLIVKHTTLYSMRADVNRDGKALAARYEAMPDLHEDVPEEEVSAKDLLVRLDHANAQIDSAQRKQMLVESAEAGLATAVAANKAAVAEVERIERLLAEAKQAVLNYQEIERTSATKVSEAREALAEAKKLQVDPEPIKAELLAVEDLNRKVRENAARRALALELESKREESRSLTAEMDAIDQQRAEIVAAAKYPVPGLGFDAEGFVTMNGLPFDQASQAEQLRVSVAIGLALNPKLRVLLVRDASLLDSAALEILGEMAIENDAQLWLERVEEGGATVVIEDGAVASTPEPEVAK